MLIIFYTVIVVGGGARLNQLCHHSRNGLIAKFPGTYESGLGKNYNCPLWLSEERTNLHPWGGVFHCQPQPVQCEHFQRAAWTKELFRQYSLFKPRLQLTTNEWILEGFYYLELENTQRGDNSSFLYPSLDYIGLGNLDRTGGITSQLPLGLKNNNKITLLNYLKTCL